MRKPQLLGDHLKIELSLSWKIILTVLGLVFSSGVGLLTWAYALADKVVVRSDDHTDIKLRNFVTYQDWVTRIDLKERVDSAWRQEMRDRMTRVEDKVNTLHSGR